MAFKNLDAQPKPFVPRPWYARHWRAVLVLTVLLVSVTAGLLWRPLAREWHSRQARELAAKAQTLMDEGNWKEAAPLLEKAYTTDAKDPVVLRACAFYETQGAKNPMLSGHFLKALLATDQADSKDKAAMGKALVATGRMEEARKIHESLPIADRKSKDALELESQLAMKAGDKPRATELMRTALTKAPEDPESIYQLAALDLQSPVEELQKDAWQRLWDLAHTDSKTAFNAIGKIARHPLTTPAQSAALVELTTVRKDTPTSLRYFTLRGYLTSHPMERNSVLDREAARAKDLPEDELVAFCQWMSDVEEYGRLMTFLPIEAAAKSVKLLPFHINAMLKLGKWSELRKVLTDEKKLPLDPLSLAELRAKCARGLNESPANVRGPLEQGREFAIAARDNAGLDRFSNVALSLGYPDVALDCLRKISTSTQAQREALLERITTIQRSENMMAGLMISLREIAAFPNTPPERVEEFIYLRLISGVELETAMDDCTAFAAKGRLRPQAVAFFKALSAYRFDDAAGVKAAFAAIDPKTLPANWRAVYAGILSESGDKARAFQIAEKIPGGLLTTEEQQIFASAL